MRTSILLLATFTATLSGNATQPQMQQEIPEPQPKQPVVSLDVTPAAVKLAHSRDYSQIIVTARLADGATADVTRFAKFAADGISVTQNGIVSPHEKRNGAGRMAAEFGGKRVEIPWVVTGAETAPPVDFIRDVNPVMTKLGCNSGTCHGAKDGKLGFKLSLRGYDPLYDVRSLKDDLAGRRLNVASPDDSLMLLKSTAGVPHEGGQRTKMGEKYYEIMRAWIADGAKLDVAVPRVTGIEVSPVNPVVQEPGSRQQFRVIAKFADGKTRDVTQEAFIESGNGDVAGVVPEVNGLVKTLRRGEAPVLARYEGAYAATTVTVMGDRTGFVWQEPETWGRIDELVAAKWQRMKILPSGLCTDADFIRRVHLDLTGLPPGPEETRAFIADAAPAREKREALVNKLIGSPDFVEHWTNKWADMLQVNSKFLGGGVKGLHEWIRKEVAANTPYDEFVRKVITAAGSNKDNPPASYWKILREPAETMENTTHLFLATRFNCNKCHDHPFERWTQDQYYQLGAFFAQVALKEDPQSGGAKIGGTAVESAKPLYELITDKKDGEMIHDRTKKVAEPKFPYEATYEAKGTRRENLAAWMTSADNRYFASSYVNRLWGYMLGHGIIEPLDDIRAGNPASNPELLEYLTREFITAKFDARHVMRLICTSRTYQLSVATNKWNEDDKTNYSHALARRLPSEVLYDSVLKVTGSGSRLPGGVRAGMLTDAQSDLPSGFLANTGRPVRESSCECERSSDLRLGSVMALLSGAAVSDAIGDPNNALAKLVAAQSDDGKLVNELFVRVLNRPATEPEIKTTLGAWTEVDKDHAAVLAKLEEKEKEQAPFIAKAEAGRAAAIAAAKKALADYEPEAAKKYAEAETKRAADLAAAEKAAKEYEEKSVAGAVENFFASAPVAFTYTGWQPLDIVESRATNGATLTKLPDGSLLAGGPRPDTADYVVKVDTKLANITGIMIEVLQSPDEANFGGGRANDGNFVLGEFVAKAGDFGSGANPVDLKFTAASADFSQQNYDVPKAIDGKRNDGGNGWAVHPRTGQPHAAAFTFEKPVGNAEKGVRLRFEMHFPLPGRYTLARFRLWATTAAAPLNPGYPVAVIEALRKPPQARTDADRAAALAYWKQHDPELIKRQLAAGKLKHPTPEDPGLGQRRAAIAAAEVPIKLDAALIRLRSDAEQSKAQLANRRLTGAQDLVWALVNTPAFLFNR
jgi:Protein of unknown function (DUF1549)/Protein of unknown function (DUF1553)